MAQRTGYYVLLAKFPDTTRVMAGTGIWAQSDSQRAWQYMEFKRIVSLNPDVEIDPETFMSGPYDKGEQMKRLDEAAERIAAEDPDRVSVGELRASGAVTQPARLLHDPEIARMLKAHKASKVPAASDAPPPPISSNGTATAMKVATDAQPPPAQGGDAVIAPADPAEAIG